MKSIRNGTSFEEEDQLPREEKGTRRLTIDSEGKTNVVVDTLGDTVNVFRWLLSVGL